MIEEELFNAYSKLDINQKRNQISSELEKIGLLLDAVHKELNIQKMPSSIYSYNKAIDQSMLNDEYFVNMYKNIIYIRKDILTLINELMKYKKGN